MKCTLALDDIAIYVLIMNNDTEKPAPRDLCSVPSQPGIYVDATGRLTRDPLLADSYRSASEDEDTWRPPPLPVEAGRYASVTPVSDADVADVIAFASRRLRLSSTARDAIEAVLRLAVEVNG